VRLFGEVISSPFLTNKRSGIALLQILKAEELSINDLAALKVNIEKEVDKLADKLKKKYSLEKDVEAIFSLSNFFILEPNNK